MAHGMHTNDRESDLYPLLSSNKSEIFQDDDSNTMSAYRPEESPLRAKPRTFFLRTGVLVCLAALMTALLVFGTMSGDKAVNETHIGTLPKDNDGIYKQLHLTEIEQTDQLVSLVTFWNRGSVPTYFRHFFHTVKLNNGTVDLLFINRLIDEGDQCIDFAAAGIVVPDNIKVVCMGANEWLERIVGFLCSEDGWACNDAERAYFLQYFTTHRDLRNTEWRPLQGYIYRDLMLRQTQYWAFVDNDMILGHMNLLPFDLMSKFSWVTFHQRSLEKAYFGGQMSVFNYGEPLLATVWKRIPHFETAQAYIENNVLPSYEEKMWSWAYLSTQVGLPGADLSYILFPDQRGDEGRGTNVFLISGNDVLHLDVDMTRIQAENVLLHSRALLRDPSGFAYASEGSSLFLPKSDPAKWLSQFQVTSDEDTAIIVEEAEYVQKCPKSSWVDPQYRLCILDHKLSKDNGAWRATIMHTKSQPAGKVFRRLDLDQRLRLYSRKLFKHHLFQKRLDWFQFPPFEIEDDMILMIEPDRMYVFALGESRDKTLYSVHSKKI